MTHLLISLYSKNIFYIFFRRKCRLYLIFRVFLQLLFCWSVHVHMSDLFGRVFWTGKRDIFVYLGTLLSFLFYIHEMRRFWFIGRYKNFKRDWTKFWNNIGLSYIFIRFFYVKRILQYLGVRGILLIVHLKRLLDRNNGWH